MNNYSHKLNMYLEDFKTLCFSAYFKMNDITKFSIISVPIFNKDEISISLFHDILNGNLRHKFVDSNMNEQEIDINESTPEKILKNIYNIKMNFSLLKLSLSLKDKKENEL